MYNLIIRNKELTITPSNRSYAKTGDTLIGKFDSYTQVANWVASIPEGFGRTPLNNISWLQSKASKFTGKTLSVAKTTKTTVAPVAKKVTRRSYEEMEDMGMGHMSAEGFINY